MNTPNYNPETGPTTASTIVDFLFAVMRAELRRLQTLS